VHEWTARIADGARNLSHDERRGTSTQRCKRASLSVQTVGRRQVTA
jgi:hypothetical protein